MEKTVSNDYTKPEEIDAAKELRHIMYMVLAKLREMEQLPPEKYLECAPAVYKMLVSYLDSPFTQ